MYIGAARLILDDYGNDDLARKHREIELLAKKIRSHFNAACAEVEDFDDYERGVLGVSLVASSEKQVRASLKKILDFVDANSFARVTMEDTQFYLME